MAKGKALGISVNGRSGVVENLSPIGDIPDDDMLGAAIQNTPLPVSESVARELVGLDPQKQREVWPAAVLASDNGQPTAAQVVENLSPMGDLGPMGPIPQSERGARELAGLEPDEQREAWRAVENLSHTPSQ